MIPEVAGGDGEDSGDAELLLPLRPDDADLHEGKLALEEALRQLTEGRLVVPEGWEAEEHHLALEGPFLLLQEELDVVPDPAHRYTLQFCVGLVDITE